MARRPSQRQTLQLETLETRQMLSGAGGSAVSVATEVAPTAEKQYMLELVNLLRTKPSEAAQRLTSKLAPSTVATLDHYNVDLNQVRQRITNVQPRQPLAWSNQLGSAAQSHSDDMATRGFQSHTGSDGSSPDQRMERAGYKGRKTRENAFAYAESVDQAMQAFTFDWGVQNLGHLRNMTDPDSSADDSLKEMGVGVADSSRPGFAKVVTQKFGLRDQSPSYLLGVAYNDLDNDRFYTPGEGQGGVQIDVTDSQGQTIQTLSGDAGGYQIPLTPGTYTLRARVDGQVVREETITMGRQNQKIDFVLNELTPIPSQPTTPPVAEAQTIAPPKKTRESQQRQTRTESNTTPTTKPVTAAEPKVVETETNSQPQTPTQPESSNLQDEALEAMFLESSDSITNWSTWSYSDRV